MIETSTRIMTSDRINTDEILAVKSCNINMKENHNHFISATYNSSTNYGNDSTCNYMFTINVAEDIYNVFKNLCSDL